MAEKTKTQVIDTVTLGKFARLALRPDLEDDELEELLALAPKVLEIADVLLEAGEVLPAPLGTFLGLVHAVVEIGKRVAGGTEPERCEECGDCLYFKEKSGLFTGSQKGGRCYVDPKAEDDCPPVECSRKACRFWA